MAITRSYSASVRFPTGVKLSMIPALLTKMSNWPKVWVAKSITPSTSSCFTTLVTLAAA